MNSTYQVSFINGLRGSLAVSKWSPSAASDQLIVCIQPFAEELNRCRRVFAQTAQRLANNGFHVWMPDFYGTGDSDGDFADIDFELWLKDLSSILISSNFHNISFISCRFGVQLLSAFLKENYNFNVERIVLWQPQWDIALFWKQQWRLSVLSGINNESKTSIPALRQLELSGFVDIQGYQIPFGFNQYTSALNENLSGFSRCPILWIECQASELLSQSVSARLNVLQHLSCHNVDFVTLPVSAFWLTQEPLEIEPLVDITVRFFEDSRHG